MKKALLILTLALNTQIAAEDPYYIIKMEPFAAMVGNSNDKGEGAFVTGNSVFELNKDADTTDDFTYGEAAFRLEIGSGFGISGYDFPSATGNYSRYAFNNEYTRYLLIGLDFLSFSYSAVTNGRRLDFFQWTPMVSLGPKFDWSGGKRFIALTGRFGGSLGRFTSKSKNLGYGGGLYYHGPRVNLIAEYLRHGISTINVADQLRVSLHYMVTETMGIGLSAESLEYDKDANQALVSLETGRRSEKRIIVSLHTAPVFMAIFGEPKSRNKKDPFEI